MRSIRRSPYWQYLFAQQLGQGRFTRRRGRGVSVILLIMVLLLLRWLGGGPTEPLPPALDEGLYRVQQVIDGDTLRLEGGRRLRLQGIDTPERDEPGYHAATEFTERFVSAAGSQVRLTWGKERLDRHGRLLGYVWHAEQMLNEELVRAGLADARLDYRYSETMKRRFAAAEKEARQAQRGFWAAQAQP